jgi:two-component system nitrogen regulation sensor histidine kinase NtrY
VPEAQRERVLERSVQVVEGNGSGLGLFIARRLMEEQHGTITVAARPGGGTSVLLRFGVRAAEPTFDADSTAPTPAPMLVGA